MNHRRIITIVLEGPKECDPGEQEIALLMKILRKILPAFVCDDYEILIKSEIAECIRHE